MTWRLASTLLVGCLLAALASPSCAGKRERRIGVPPGPSIGVYKARVLEPDRRTRRFRLLLFAELPDRIHGEIVSPVGTTLMILDGGRGRLAVSLVRRRLAFVGPARPESLERVLGLRLSLEDLVGGLLTGRVSDLDYEVKRTELRPGGLPRMLEISSGARTLSLELRRLEPLGRRAELLGTGEPPERMERRPLDDLLLQELPEEIEVSEEQP